MKCGIIWCPEYEKYSSYVRYTKNYHGSLLTLVTRENILMGREERLRRNLSEIDLMAGETLTRIAGLRRYTCMTDADNAASILFTAPCTDTAMCFLTVLHDDMPQVRPAMPLAPV